MKQVVHCQRELHAITVLLGMVANAALGKGLKRLIRQARPLAGCELLGSCAKHGMPSSHVQVSSALILQHLKSISILVLTTKKSMLCVCAWQSPKLQVLLAASLFEQAIGIQVAFQDGNLNVSYRGSVEFVYTDSLCTCAAHVLRVGIACSAGLAAQCTVPGADALSACRVYRTGAGVCRCGHWQSLSWLP